jgi:hypothetical protein
MRIALVIVVALVLLLGTHLLLGWLASRRKIRVPRQGGVAVLRMARGRNAVLGALSLPPAILLLVVPLAIPAPGAGGLAFSVLVSAAAFAVSAYFFVAEAKKRLRVDDSAIERVGVFTRRRVRWSDVEKIAYNPTSRWFFLQGRDGTRVWVYEAFEGVGDFAELALRNLPPAVLAAGLYVREELEDLAEA